MLRIALAVAWTIAASTTFAQAETVLRYNRWLSVDHHVEKNVFIPWMAEVEKATNGRVKIEPTTSSLGAVSRQHEIVVSGIADVVFTSDSYTPGLFPLSEILEIPFAGSDVEKLSVAYWYVYKSLFEKTNPYPGTKVLALASTPTYAYFNRIRPIESAKSLEGLKLRVSGGNATKLNQALGVTAVSSSVSQVIEMLSTGVIDGAFLTDDAINSFNLTRYLKYRTVFPGGLGSNSLVVLMNGAKWASLSEADRAAIDRVSGEVLSRKMGQSYAAGDAAAREAFEKAKVESAVANEQFVARVGVEARKLEAAWIEAAKKKGVDGAAALKMLRERAQ